MTRLPNTQVAGLYRRNVGGFRVATIHDGMLDTAFTDIVGFEPAAWEAAHLAACRPLPPLLSCNTFVVETDDRLILIDAGCGDTAAAAGKHSAGLAAMGIAPGDIDAVLMTHLHRDHAAGLIDASGHAVFPDAEIIAHEAELAFWQDDANLSRLRESQKVDFRIANAVLRAYADRMRSVDAGQVYAGIAAVPVPGHTPGHTAWLLESNGDSLLIWGDVVHLPVIQFAHPEASLVYDVDSTDAAGSRKRLFDMVAADRIPVAGVHLDFPCFGHVRAGPGGGFTYWTESWTSIL